MKFLQSITESKKEYSITVSRKRRDDKDIVGTLDYFIDYFSYTLEVGASWAHERGNHKINRKPKSIKSLISNLNWAKSNAAANGSPDTYYTISESKL